MPLVRGTYMRHVTFPIALAAAFVLAHPARVLAESPGASASATAHAIDELHNAIAQGKVTLTPTVTPTVTSTPTATPQPTNSPAPSETPTVTSTPGPPCWADDNGDKWLIVDGDVYFDTDGNPVQCPDPLKPHATELPTPTDAPFIQPNVIFPTPQVIIRDVVREVVVYRDAPTDAPTDTPTGTPTDTPIPTPTLTSTPTATSTSSPTPTSTPTSRPTATRQPTPMPQSSAAEEAAAAPAPPRPYVPAPWPIRSAEVIIPAVSDRPAIESEL